jgi:hypothetical protein
MWCSIFIAPRRNRFPEAPSVVGLFEERCIYLRYTNSPPMEGTLIHEMAHTATTSEHGQEWLNEMVRLKAAGAPVPDWAIESLVG